MHGMAQADLVQNPHPRFQKSFLRACMPLGACCERPQKLKKKRIIECHIYVSCDNTLNIFFYSKNDLQSIAMDIGAI